MCALNSLEDVLTVDSGMVSAVGPTRVQSITA